MLLIDEWLSCKHDSGMYRPFIFGSAVFNMCLSRLLLLNVSSEKKGKERGKNDEDTLALNYLKPRR